MEQTKEQTIITKKLSTQALIKYFLGVSEEIEDLIICKPNTIELITTDQMIYEALCCVNQHQKVNSAKLVKLFESTKVIADTRVIITQEKLLELQESVGKEHFPQ